MGKSTYYYVYIIQSLKDPNRFYTGFSEELDARLKAHNQSKDPHTAKYKPWKIKTAIAFTDRDRALDFERYLKSPSGRAFAKKRLQVQGLFCRPREKITMIHLLAKHGATWLPHDRNYPSLSHLPF